MNAWLDVRCRTLWFEVEHPDYTGVTIADALDQEQIYLMPMPTPFDGYVEVIARVSSTCLVTVERNQYSVPCHLANSKATIHLYADRVDVCTEKAIIARHQRLLGRDQVSYDWQHYIPLIERKPGALSNGAPFADMPLLFAQLQTALRHRERQQGDRIMTNVLGAVPTHGQLLAAEATDRSIRAIGYQMSSAKFPIHRDLLGFDFGQSKVDQQQVNKLATMKFTDAAQNLVLVGGTGTGKTHLATALGVSGIQHHSKRVRFFSTVELVNSLEQEKAAGKQG